MTDIYVKALADARRRQLMQQNALRETRELLSSATKSGFAAFSGQLLEKEKRQALALAQTDQVVSELERASGALPLQKAK